MNASVETEDSYVSYDERLTDSQVITLDLVSIICHKKSLVASERVTWPAILSIAVGSIIGYLMSGPTGLTTGFCVGLIASVGFAWSAAQKNICLCRFIESHMEYEEQVKLVTLLWERVEDAKYMADIGVDSIQPSKRTEIVSVVREFFKKELNMTVWWRDD